VSSISNSTPYGIIKETGYLIPCAIESCLSTMVFKGINKIVSQRP
jgi:hypothetical protein